MSQVGTTSTQSSDHQPTGPVYVVNLPGYSFTDALQMKFQKYKSLPVMIRRQTRWCRWRKKGILQIVILQGLVAGLFFLGHLVMSNTEHQERSERDYKMSVQNGVDGPREDTLQSIIAQWDKDVGGRSGLDKQGPLTLGQLAMQQEHAQDAESSQRQQQQPFQNAVAFDQFVKEVAVQPDYSKQSGESIRALGVNNNLNKDNELYPLQLQQQQQQQFVVNQPQFLSENKEPTSPPPPLQPSQEAMQAPQFPANSHDLERLKESMEVLMGRGGHTKEGSRMLYKQLAMLGVLQAQMADASEKLKEMMENQELELIGN